MRGTPSHTGVSPSKIYFLITGFNVDYEKSYFCIQFKRWRFPISRVVYRGNNNANPNGGVSMSNANNDFSNTNTNVGSRLNNNRKEILIGVQHRGLVPTVVPREASLSNSSPEGLEN